MLVRLRDLLDVSAVLREYGEPVIKPDLTRVNGVFLREPSPNAAWPEAGVGLKLSQQQNLALYLMPDDAIGLAEHAVLTVQSNDYLITDVELNASGLIRFGLRAKPTDLNTPDPAARWQ